MNDRKSQPEANTEQLALDELGSRIESNATEHDGETDGVNDVVKSDTESLPTFLPKESIPPIPIDPRKASPNHCDQCGEQAPYGEPLESGPPEPEPCSPKEIEDCDCCVCPTCGARSIYYRKSKTPDYRCRNPDCEAREFARPAYPRMQDLRDCIYFECIHCGEPTLAPSELTPEGEPIVP